MNPNDFLESIKLQFKSGNKHIQLIVINVFVFVIISLFGVLSFLSSSNLESSIVDFLALPSKIPNIILQPWSIFTYMFLHQDFWHILFNMLTFYWFGKLFLTYLTQRRLMHVYFLGGLFGAFFYVLFYNILPVFANAEKASILLGASASILAIMFTIASYQPETSVNLMFIGQIRLKYLAIFIVVIDVLSIPNGNAGGMIAHIGGAFFGTLYGFGLKNGYDLSKYLTFNFSFKNPFKRKPKMKVHYKKPISDEEYVKQKTDNQKKIDKILEKISQSGYESLSKEEKEMLFKASNK
ncbi:MAG: rhomboid family intramembrane serine protease [Bacteroidota bacterium]